MKLITLLFIICVSTVAMAQFGTEREAARYRVVDFPRYYVEQSQRTYCVDVKMSKKVGSYVDADELIDRLAFSGWTKTDAEHANMRMAIEFGDFIYEATEILDQSTEEKTKDGGVKRKPLFIGTIKYTFPIKISMIASEGKYSSQINDGLAVFKCEKNFETRKAASEYMRENKDVFVEKIIVGDADIAIRAANSGATRSFGFGSTTEKVEYYYLDSKKGKYFEQQKEDADAIEVMAKGSNANEPINPEGIAAVIDHFIGIINELDNNDKKQKKARNKLMISVAELNLMRDDLEACASWAQRIVDEYKDNDGKDILDKVNKVREMFEKHHVTSRHFSPVAPEL